MNRHARISAMSIHGAIQRDLDRSARYPKQSRMAVVRPLESDIEAQAINIKRLGSRQIVSRKDWNGSLHGEILPVAILSWPSVEKALVE